MRLVVRVDFPDRLQFDDDIAVADSISLELLRKQFRVVRAFRGSKFFVFLTAKVAKLAKVGVGGADNQ